MYIYIHIYIYIYISYIYLIYNIYISYITFDLVVCRLPVISLVLLAVSVIMKVSGIKHNYVFRFTVCCFIAVKHQSSLVKKNKKRAIQKKILTVMQKH